jgi:hypothetical protein
MHPRPTGVIIKNSTYIDVHRECVSGIFGFQLEKFNDLMYEKYGIIMSYNRDHSIIFDLAKFLIFQLKYPECIENISYEQNCYT